MPSVCGRQGNPSVARESSDRDKTPDCPPQTRAGAVALRGVNTTWRAGNYLEGLLADLHEGAVDNRQASVGCKIVGHMINNAKLEHQYSNGGPIVLSHDEGDAFATATEVESPLDRRERELREELAMIAKERGALACGG